jgi:Tfp pilus assembly protein PilO
MPDAFRMNAYRVLRLSVSASVTDIHKAAASMRRAATLGLATTTEADIPALGQVPRTDADIRSAVGRLANPLQRLSDRVFWFYNQPQSVVQISDPASHDEALRDLFRAFQASLDDSGVATWVKALRAWHAIVCDDAYWSLALAHEEQGGFEPTAIFSEVEAVRADAVRLAAEPLILAGRAALAADHGGSVRRILAALAGLADTGPWAATAVEDIASPAIEHFRRLCQAAHEKYGSKIVREQDAGERNKNACEEALENFRGEIQPALDRLTRLLPQDHELSQRVRENAAIYLSGLATDYTWANDFVSSEKLQEEALTIARNTLGAVRIEDRLSQVRQSARKQRVFGALKPIASAPSLHTINGFGFRMYGRSDHDPETNSHVTTYYFVALFVPVFPIARYRIIDAGGGKYRFLGKLPLRKMDRWHLGIVAAIIAAMILSAAMSSEQNSSSSATPTNQTSAFAASASRISQLSSLKARIDQIRAQTSVLESQLQPVIGELINLNLRLNKLAADLKALNDLKSAGSQIDVNDYNAKIDTYNEILERRKALLAANRDDLQKYEDLSKQDAALVDEYNGLLKAGAR